MNVGFTWIPNELHLDPNENLNHHNFKSVLPAHPKV